MYEVDDQDAVVELAGVPQSSVGAPLPVVVSSEHALMLAYIVQRTDPKWDGTYVRIVGPDTPGETVALVRFDRPYAHAFGPPNDEAFSGHPLSARGLVPYSASEVLHSSWIRSLERMNSVHPYHKPEPFWAYRHFIFAFHDSTFECVATAFTVTLREGSIASMLEEMAKAIG